MSDKPAIACRGLGKMYRLFAARLDGVLDALGLSWLRPGRGPRYREFWALRGIDLVLPRGARVGVIGRNGAGKSTLLKLITGNLEPTEGTLGVRGNVQALLQAGAGMHPEFTGHENIEAALTYQGLSPAEIRAATADIADFTELGGFLQQPFKTYSAGMQARLAFAVATVLKPEILIIDEVLGAGDGYFLTKSNERIRKLIKSGATVLLVSHSMAHIQQFCERAVWIDRGRVALQGPSLEVIKAYEQYLRLLEERRLRGNNSKRRDRAYGVGSCDLYSDCFVLQFRAEGVPPGRLDIGEVSLCENDRPYETLRIGGPQDCDATSPAFVPLAEGTGWSAPRTGRRGPYRSLPAGSAAGQAVFYLYCFNENVEYAFDIDFRPQGLIRAVAEVVKGGQVIRSAELPADGEGWKRWRLVVGCVRERPGDAPTGAAPDTAPEPAPAEPPQTSVRRWPGLGDLIIADVILLGEDDREQTVFAHGSPLSIMMRFVAQRAGRFPVLPSVALYRREDGVLVSQQVGTAEEPEMAAGEARCLRLDLGPLLLGNGQYVLSAALFQQLDLQDLRPPERYDLIDRSYEFRVYGRPVRFQAVFQHPGAWTLLPPGAVPATRARSA